MFIGWLELFFEEVVFEFDKSIDEKVLVVGRFGIGAFCFKYRCMWGRIVASGGSFYR